MAYLKTLQPPHQVFSTTKPSSTTTSVATVKSIKDLIHSLIVAHICRAFRALRRAKSILLQALKNHHHRHFPNYLITSHTKHHKKPFFGSFRLHYNWGSTSSSHVTPVPESVLRGCSSDPDHYFHSSSSDHVEEGAAAQSQYCSTLAGYLLWLEENNNYNKTKSWEGEDGDVAAGGVVANEIDRLAEMFIADCHEKFQLEKQESLRRFHEMLARSM